ncbi:CRAL/TRIO domain-containing protein [Fomitiporia mediterranea MF3/22]|uniref:CRAL/TRIO domain-containing protein n=1 Tax=Fomitiporia mediterranea (strain MF3/22) TaxID=694068 RepID=UPI00044077C0|nr:CRAL/TRIO domain-containing protein [Fomitiporia mediterranea MF3/22]EJD07682.1 CRAL/TRIO domain-containing protein [Fomitiporia mediterranea MF3/22]
MSEPTPADATVPSAEPATAPAPAAEVEEPQNALTKKFTEAEWKALKEFRATLPSVVEEVYGKEKPETIKLWGVSFDPKGTADARASVVLMKFLRARDLNVENAKAMLVKTLKWRIEFKTDDILKEEFPQDVFGNLGHIYGKDKEGRPVTYNLYGGNQDLKAVFGDVDRFIRWRVQLMEKGIALIDFENIDQMVQVHDYEGVGLRSRDANSKKAAATASTIFQDYYPEFLYKKFFVNVPAIFNWIFWLFKPIISAQTLAKMSVVGTGAQVIGKELLPIVDAKELPKRYGGEADAF